MVFRILCKYSRGGISSVPIGYRAVIKDLKKDPVLLDILSNIQYTGVCRRRIIPVLSIFSLVFEYVLMLYRS